MSNGNRSGWAVGLPIIGVLAFGVRLLSVCGRSSSHTPSYNYNPPTLPPNIDYSALLGILDAGPPTRASGDEPDVLAFDATNVYVADAKERAIFVQPRSGGTRTQLARTAGVVHGMAVGATDVYFTTSTTIGAKKLGALMKVPTRGGIATSVLSSGTYLPERVTLDARAIFFTSPNDPGALSASVLRVPIATGGGGSVTILDVDPNAPVAWSVVTDDANVYFTTVDGTQIASIPKTGGETKTLVSDQLLAHELTADADALYWTDGLAGKVFKVAKRGGAPVVIATGETDVGGIAVDGTSVYWVSTTAGSKLSTIMRAPKSGGVAKALVSGLRGVRNVASDGTRTYWSQSGAVFWVSGTDPVASWGAATVHPLGGTTTSSTFDAGVASRGAYGTGTSGGGTSSGGGSVIRTFRSKDK